MPYLYSEVYISITQHSVHTLVCKHSCCCYMRQLEKSVVAEHAFSNDDRRVLFEETKFLSSETAYYPQLHMESMKIFIRGSVVESKRRKPPLK